MDILSGLGLATSSGLNAYIPLLVLGLLDRFTGFIDLGPGFAWLSNGWILAIIAVLLVVEILADKFPAIDTVNDAIQSVVRPTSGGIVFGSAATSEIAGITMGGQTETVTDPAGFLASNAWIPVLTGIVIALVVHLAKSFTRPLANTATAGSAAPVLSTGEDVVAAGLSLVAVLLPFLVLVFLIGILAAFFLLRRRFRHRRTRKPDYTPPSAAASGDSG